MTAVRKNVDEAGAEAGSERKEAAPSPPKCALPGKKSFLGAFGVKPKSKPKGKSRCDGDNESKEADAVCELQKQHFRHTLPEAVKAAVDARIAARYKEIKACIIGESDEYDPGTVDHNEDRAQSVVTERRPKPSQCPSFAGRRPRNSPSSDDYAESDRVASKKDQLRHPMPAAGTENVLPSGHASKSSLESPPKKRTESSVEDGRKKKKKNIGPCNAKSALPFPHTSLPFPHDTTQCMQYVEPIRRNDVVTASREAVVTANGDLYGQLSFASVRIFDGADTHTWLVDLRTFGAMVIVVEVSTEAHEAHDLVVDLAHELSQPSIGFTPGNRLKGVDRHEADWQRQYNCRVYKRTIVGYRENDQIASLTEVNQESSVEDRHTAERMKVFQLDLTKCICGHDEVKFAVPFASLPMSSAEGIDERQVVADVKYLIDNEVRVVFGNEEMDPHKQIIDELKHTARIHVLRPHPSDAAYIMFIGEIQRGIRPSRNTVDAITWSNTENLCEGKDYLWLGEDWKDRDWKPIQSVDYKYLPDQPFGTSKVWIFWGANRSNRSQKNLTKRAYTRGKYKPVVTGTTRDPLNRPGPTKQGQIGVKRKRNKQNVRPERK